MSSHDIAKLNDLYTDSDACDKEVFAEQRSNILLVSSEHYRKVSHALNERFKDVPKAEQHKLRITQNHTAVITSHYKNAIVAGSPSVKILPANQNEAADVKSAELNDSVVQDAKRRHKFRDKIMDWTQDYIDIGEVACRVYWDEHAGELVGYEQEVDERGQPLFKDTAGQLTTAPATIELDPQTLQQTQRPHEPVASKRAVFSGDFKFERVMGFNLLRAKQAESIGESPYLIIRRMVDIEHAKLLVGDDETKQGYITESAETTFKVFDSHKGEYVDSKGQVMFREYYFRACHQYPQGYYYITTENGILFEGELPFGVYPIIYRGFDKIQTSPRARSIIKRLRPYQAEINRAASEIATAQLALTPKLLVHKGSQLSKGADLPGARVIMYTGAKPEKLDGYSGEGYLGYLNSKIDEMYKVGMVADVQMEAGGQMDAYTMLHRSLKQKQKFSLYVQAFEEFIVEVFETFLKLARHYYDESRVIRIAGRREQVNIAEFKKTDPLDYQIKVQAMSDDIETTLGKQLQINHIIQFLGPQLPKEALGQIIKAAPFLNKEEILDQMTIDHECVTNDLLALDRGEMPEVNQHDDHKLYIKRVTHRMKQSDFRFLGENIKANYQQFMMKHMEAEAQLARDLQAAQAGFIPTGGGLIKCDLTEPDPNTAGATRRMMFPGEALQWLRGMLEKQGSTQDLMQQLPPSAIADMGKMIGPAPTQQPAPMPTGSQQPGGNAMPPVQLGQGRPGVPNV